MNATGSKPIDSRFSQAQLLIAALFSVVMRGEMPEMQEPIEGAVEPLEEEFAGLFTNGKKHIRGRLTNSCVLWIPYERSALQRRAECCVFLSRTKLIPSAIARVTNDLLGNPEFSWKGSADPTVPWLPAGVAAKITREHGVPASFVLRCWDMPETLDQAWYLCRAELVRIQAERQGGKPKGGQRG